MVFCGQCGFQLAPGTLRCPRCGAMTEADSGGATVESLPSDGPTVASRRVTQNPSRPTYGPNTSGYDPQPLVLRDNVEATYNNTQGTYGATPRGVSPSYNPYQTQAATEQAGGQNYTAPGNYGSPSASSYATPGTPPYPQTYIPAEKPAQRTNGGRITGLVLILLGLLLILGSMGLFAYQHKMLPWISHSSTSPTVTVTTTALTPAEQANAVVRQYYKYVNQQDYQDAYKLRKDITNYQNFVAGYQNTQHVELTITNTQQLSDGTFKVSIILRAIDSNKPRPTIYHGYYIVGPQNGQWFILSGKAQ